MDGKEYFQLKMIRKPKQSGRKISQNNNDEEITVISSRIQESG